MWTSTSTGHSRLSTRPLRILLVAFAAGLLSGIALLKLVAAVQAAWLRRRTAALSAATQRLWSLKQRRPIIGVTGSGSSEELRLARDLGECCARNGFHILTGGGRGVMTSVARAFAQARLRGVDDAGMVLAVLPGLPAARAKDWATAREEVTSKLLVDQSSGTLQYSVLLDNSLDEEDVIVAPDGYPNEFVDVAIRTHLPSSGSAGLSMLSRNHISVLSVDVIVALPGDRGTASEVELAVHYGVPVCQFLGPSGAIQCLSHRACARAPAFENIAGVEGFILDVMNSGSRQPASLSSTAGTAAGSALSKRASSLLLDTISE